MFLLKKVIQLRDKTTQDEEKPFLEHLEDLRKMVSRVVLTLVVSMLMCFAYHNEIMVFFRRPVDKVMLTQIENTLPEKSLLARPLTVESWRDALKVEDMLAKLPTKHRQTYDGYLQDPETMFHVECITVLRAAMTLPEDKRQAFVDSLDETAEIKKQVKALLVTKPMTEPQRRGDLNMMSALKPTEGFMLSMKLSFVAGVVLSFPILMYFIMQFILPGLHKHERKVLWPSLAIGFGLFLAGATFAYSLILPRALFFFYSWSGDMGISNDWRIGEYISFATSFTLLFGVSFELPVVVMILVKLGILSYDLMSRTRSYAIVAILVAAGVLTPTPDIPTMMLMAAPMIVLYEICIWLAFFDRKKRARILAEERAKEEQEMAEYRTRKHEQSAVAAALPYQSSTELTHEQMNDEELALAIAAERWHRETVDDSVHLGEGAKSTDDTSETGVTEPGDEGWDESKMDEKQFDHAPSLEPQSATEQVEYEDLHAHDPCQVRIMDYLEPEKDPEPHNDHEQKPS